MNETHKKKNKVHRSPSACSASFSLARGPIKYSSTQNKINKTPPPSPPPPTQNSSFASPTLVCPMPKGMQRKTAQKREEKRRKDRNKDIFVSAVLRTKISNIILPSPRVHEGRWAPKNALQQQHSKAKQAATRVRETDRNKKH